MRQTMELMGTASQASSYLIGGLVLLLAVAVLATGAPVSEVTSWAWDVLGLTFAGLLTALVFGALFCWVRLGAEQDAARRAFWLTAGVQAANGIATLALTYTLLGISLGIGSLAGQELTPDTVQGVIQSLTKSFSMAFMTTVIGLPSSALLRSMLVVSGARVSNRRSVLQRLNPNHEGPGQ